MKLLKERSFHPIIWVGDNSFFCDQHEQVMGLSYKLLHVVSVYKRIDCFR